MHDLLGSERPAGVAAHAIGNDSERYATLPRMRQNGNAILLLLAISLVLCSARIDCYGHCFSLSAGRLARKAYAMQ
jgi:hypothetical protein